MQDELEKIDLLRERMDISYREAKEALAEAGGDVVEALIRIEENKGRGWSEELWDKGEKIAGQVRTYVNKGNRTKIKLRRGDRTIAQFPATAGALGILAALASPQLAVLAGIGAIAAVAKKVSLEIEKPEGENKVIPLGRPEE